MHGYIESDVDKNSYLFPSIQIKTLLSDKILITNNLCENYNYIDGIKVTQTSKCKNNTTCANG